jgi:hypothetical protein
LWQDIHEKWISGRRYLDMTPLEEWNWCEEEKPDEENEPIQSEVADKWNLIMQSNVRTCECLQMNENT